MAHSANTLTSTEELAALEARREAGKISDDDFAVEKRRILEGPNPEG